MGDSAGPAGLRATAGSRAALVSEE